LKLKQSAKSGTGAQTPFGGGGHPSPTARKILDEKILLQLQLMALEKQEESLKEDAVNAVPSMGTPTGGSRGTERTEIVNVAVVK
jgi:2-oxoglutarate dehydrogenase E2 component (dihydrolipoamide succinyltransferase)